MIVTKHSNNPCSYASYGLCYGAVVLHGLDSPYSTCNSIYAPRLALAHAALAGRSSLRNALALGAVLSCTDSVASLQLMDPDRAPLLYALLFGEGVVNDATAIVLLGATMVGLSSGLGAAG